MEIDTTPEDPNKDKLSLEQMSPATRLLQKRRMMYEEQDKYDTKKDEFKKKEEHFQTKEAELIDQDMQLQEKMIEFSNWLQMNEVSKKKSQAKLA